MVVEEEAVERDFCCRTTFFGFFALELLEPPGGLTPHLDQLLSLW